MTGRWLGLAAGIVGVLLLCTVGFAYTASRANAVAAETATWRASSYEVGTPYAGVVQSVTVESGSEVAEGDELFRVQSPTLQEAMSKTTFADGKVGYEIDRRGVMVFTAAQAGVVQDTHVVAGEFVEADDRLATVAIDDSLRIEAEFVLSKRDYAKIPEPTTLSVDLPGGRTVSAEVYYAEVLEESSANSVRTVMLARTDDASLRATVINGAPTEAQLDLVGVGPVAWVGQQVRRLFEPGGFES